jgi:isopentenyldiphosphate isomerase
VTPDEPDPERTAGSELVDIVDETGAAVRVATRAEVRAGHLWHRSVFIAVVDDGAPEGPRVAVHQRAEWKDVWPSRWDVAFGGVLAAGEDWPDGARRELAEESGLRVRDEQLELLGEGRYEDELVREVSRVYRVRSAGPFTFDDGEVVASDWVALDELAAWVARTPVCPDSAALVVPMLTPPDAPVGSPGSGTGSA